MTSKLSFLKNPRTVKEVIELLQQLPEDWRITTRFGPENNKLLIVNSFTQAVGYLYLQREENAIERWDHVP